MNEDFDFSLCDVPDVNSLSDLGHFLDTLAEVCTLTVLFYILHIFDFILILDIC